MYYLCTCTCTQANFAATATTGVRIEQERNSNMSRHGIGTWLLNSQRPKFRSRELCWTTCTSNMYFQVHTVYHTVFMRAFPLQVKFSHAALILAPTIWTTLCQAARPSGGHTEIVRSTKLLSRSKRSTLCSVVWYYESWNARNSKKMQPTIRNW